VKSVGPGRTGFPVRPLVGVTDLCAGACVQIKWPCIPFGIALSGFTV